jgi:YVTN family beta-propeller protein
MRLFSMSSDRDPRVKILVRGAEGRACARLVQVGAALAVAAVIAGCGNNYRPVVTPVVTTGPQAQPTSSVAVVSSTGPSSPGIATIIDYSGDTILAFAPIGPGPSSFTIDASGANGYTVNSDGTITNFPVSSTLQEKQILFTTLPATASPVNMMSPQTGLWVPDLTGNVIDVFTGSPQTFKLAIPVATAPITVAGSASLSGQREYAISQNFVDSTGVLCNTAPTAAPATGLATPIELANYSTDAPISLGKCPVFAVQTPDLRRLFVLNRGDDTVTVINTQLNALDSCTPYQNMDGTWVTCHPTIQLPKGSGPVYAEYNSATQQLVVANYDGGTISVIYAPLDEYGNDSNTYTHTNCTTYAACGAITGGFGSVVTIPVGNNPASVTALVDGSKAYAANQTDETVTVVDLPSYTVEKTLTVFGHPRTVSSTQNSLFSKVYVASPDSPYLTVIESTPTATDIVDTTILTEGNIVDVRTSTQNGSAGNANYVSRVPGRGEPCNLPPGSPGLSSPLTLASCQAIP